MGRRRVKYQWDAEAIRALRRHMGLTQQQMSEELGTRQQTISEWETGMYRPRGGMNRLLSLIAEQAGFQYQTLSEAASPGEAEAVETVPEGALEQGAGEGGEKKEEQGRGEEGKEPES